MSSRTGYLTWTGSQRRPTGPRYGPLPSARPAGRWTCGRALHAALTGVTTDTNLQARVPPVKFRLKLDAL